MCLHKRALVYGNCAVNPGPSADQLADIAISSAQTASQFGVEPRMAMLPYSTRASGRGAGVEKVREATAIVRARRPDLAVEGPIQYGAAIDRPVARNKLPDVAGRATVFVFSDLNTYKAVQRSAGAIAIGPVLQGGSANRSTTPPAARCCRTSPTPSRFTAIEAQDHEGASLPIATDSRQS